MQFREVKAALEERNDNKKKRMIKRSRTKVMSQLDSDGFNSDSSPNGKRIPKKYGSAKINPMSMSEVVTSNGDDRGILRRSSTMVVSKRRLLGGTP